MPRFLYRLSGFLLCFFFAGVYTAQVLGLAGIYRAWGVFPLTLALTGLALWLYFRHDGGRFFESFPQEMDFPRWLNLLLYGLGLGLFLLLVAYPVAAWPYSTVSETLHWDAGAYHFPKAVELYKHGHVWDLSIPYGEFPFGYEAMLAFALLLAGKETFFGALHALIALLVFLTLWLLGRRYTRLPGGLLLFVVAGIFLSESLVVKGNPFYIFLDQADMIGKNDLFLAMGVLAALVHAPLGREASSSRLHFPGLVFATLLVLATKPAGMFVVTPLWFPVIWGWVKSWRELRRLPWQEVALAAVLIIPGGLWVVRNLIVIGTIFPEGVWVMNEWSMANNLTNPFFYQHLPRNLIFLMGMLGVTWLFTLWKGVPGWRISLAFSILVVAFFFTPESGFQKTTQEPTRTAWRLGIAVVGYEVVVILTLLSGAVNRILKWADRQWLGRAGLAGAAIVLTLGLVWNARGRLALNPFNEIVLRDEFRQPVGVDGYHSAYDYVQRNIRNSVIEITGGVFYYMYGPGFTNTPTKLQYPLGRADRVVHPEPEYQVIIPHGDPFDPSAEWRARWKLIYQDPEGLVFIRRDLAPAP